MSGTARHRRTGLDDLIPLYLEALETRGLASGTRAGRARALGRFAAFQRARRRPRIEQIRPDDVAAFRVQMSRRRAHVSWRRGETLAPVTVHGWMTAVRGFCRWLVDEDWLLVDPCARLRLARPPKTPPRVLSGAELARLFEAARAGPKTGVRDLALLELAYSSGLRASELVGLNVTDLDLVEHEVLVRRGKGGTSRRVPLGAPAAQALCAYLGRGREELVHRTACPDADAVFLSRTGRRLPRPSAERMMQCRVQAAGLTGHVTLHSLRHTAAVHLLAGGADVRHVQEFLGHADVQTTVHYTRLVLADLKATHARCHPRGRWPLEG